VLGLSQFEVSIRSVAAVRLIDKSRDIQAFSILGNSQSITPYPLVHLEEQANGTALPGPDTPGRGEVGTASVLDNLYLLSPVDAPEMDPRDFSFKIN
jgi:hypothetical protein